MNSTENWPRITLVTPSFNQGKFIERTIQSVLSQQYPNLEYFVVDGGSSDQTLQILKRYENKITRWVSEPDEGQGDAISKGFSWATGDILGWLNSDDCLEPGSLNFIAKIFANDPELDWIIGNDIVEIDGWSYSNIPQKKINLQTHLSGQILYQDAIFFRKTLYQSTDGINCQLWGAIDYDLWLQFLLKGGKYCTFPKVTLSRFIIHPAQKSSNLKQYLNEVEQSKNARTQIQPNPFTYLQIKSRQKLAVLIRYLYQLSIPGMRLLLSATFLRSWYFHHSELPNFKRVKQGKHDVACPICRSLSTNFRLSSYDNRFNQPGLYEIVWCESCNLGITRPQLSRSELTNLYKKFYSNSDDTVMSLEQSSQQNTSSRNVKDIDDLERLEKSTRHSLNSKPQALNISPIKRYIRQLTSSRPVLPSNWGGKLLDFGCNDGEQLEIYQQLGQFEQLCGFEINPVAAQRAQDKGFNVYCGEITSAHWQDNTFDVIVLSQVLEHLPDPVSILKILHQKLKPNGHILITCPNAQSFWAKIFGIAWSHWHVPYHLFHYTPNSISKLASEAGFEVEKITTRSPAYWLFLSQHLQRYYAKGEYLKIPIYPQPNRWTGFQAAVSQVLSIFSFDRLNRGDMISAELKAISIN